MKKFTGGEKERVMVSTGIESVIQKSYSITPSGYILAYICPIQVMKIFAIYQFAHSTLSTIYTRSFFPPRVLI